MRSVAALLPLALTWPICAAADPAEDFYKGKQIRLIVGSGAGDGYDIWSRLIARHMAKHVSGRPALIACQVAPPS